MGRIGAAHGIKGEVRIQSFTEEPLALRTTVRSRPTGRASMIEIETARATTNVLVARLKGVTDRTAAEKLNGVELYVDRDKLPPTEDDDDFYHADLIGLDARLGDGTVLGKVTAIPNFGAGDLLEVRDERTRRHLPLSRSPGPWCRQSTSPTAISSIEPPVEAEPGEEEPD